MPVLQIICNSFTLKIKGIHRVLAMYVVVITFIVWAALAIWKREQHQISSHLSSFDLRCENVTNWSVILHYTCMHMYYIHNPICIWICTVNTDIACTYVLYWNTTRSNQWKRYYTCLFPCSTKNCNTSCNTTDGLINAHLCNWRASSYYYYLVG